MEPISAAIMGGLSAGSSLLGGLLNRNSASAANQQNQYNAALNMQQQREFAQNGIQWKVADAKKAGIHPLYALGAQTTAFSPVSVGSTADTSMGNAVSNMGQDLSRAISATRTEDERVSAVTAVMSKLGVERAGLENDLLRSKIALLHQQGNPGFPSAAGSHFIPGQGNSKDPIDNAAPYSSATTISDVQYARTANGLAPAPSKNMQEAIEDMPLASIPWSLRNNVVPSFQMGSQPPSKGRMISDGFLPKGTDLSRYEWRFNPALQVWQPRETTGKPWFRLEYNNRRIF